jgi:hypothetical protein
MDRAGLLPDDVCRHLPFGEDRAGVRQGAVRLHARPVPALGPLSDGSADVPGNIIETAAKYLFAAGVVGVDVLTVPIMTIGAAYDVVQGIGR